VRHRGRAGEQRQEDLAERAGPAEGPASRYFWYELECIKPQWCSLRKGFDQRAIRDWRLETTGPRCGSLNEKRQTFVWRGVRKTPNASYVRAGLPDLEEVGLELDADADAALLVPRHLHVPGGGPKR
jgi:hypothetical protein